MDAEQDQRTEKGGSSKHFFLMAHIDRLQHLFASVFLPYS